MNLPRARTVLVADDDSQILAFVSRVLSQAGYDVSTVENGDAAIALLKSQRYDLLLSDIHMPGVDGFQLLDSALETGSIGAAVLMTGQGSISIAVRAIRQGARDFITKPLDAAQLASVVDRALGTPLASDDYIEARGFRDTHAPEVVGEHPALLDVFNLLERVADTDCNVLVSGESGTGKELIARAIHQASERRNGPFVTVNCAAIPSELMESEIFGHAKGAFTGATERRIGKFEAADGGTLFLDEIGEMDLSLQSKLLRVLQDRVFTPVGEHRSRTANVRIVTATNRDLESEADLGTFRLDLFHRLNVIPIELPPLRERGSDI
ncbi:MAG: sigma-54 dependent transcriptional regulator, partial [Myxococcota bacterium]